MSQIIIHCKYDELLSIKKCKPHPKNHNQHSNAQIKRLAEIIKYNGFRRPITISSQSEYITVGHGRLAAAKLLKMKTVPVVYQNYENEDAEYADLVADNAIAEWAELSIADVNIDIGSLGPDFDIDVLGLKNFHIEVADKYTDKEIDENIETNTECPSCGYAW